MVQYLTSKRSLIIVVVLLFVAMSAMNFYFPIYIDDWSYSFMMDHSPIGGFVDIIRNQYQHYFEWGGRSVVHIIAQCLLYIGKPWSDMLNAAAYVLLLWFAYRIAITNNQSNIIYILLAHCAIWFFVPSLGECIFWKTGSANYLWGTLLVIAFLYSYCIHYLKEDRTKSSTLKNICFFLFGIIAGWTNENMGVAMIAFLILLFILLKIEKRTIPAWMIFGLVGALVGCVLMLIAPGNFKRYESTGAYEEGSSFFLYLYYRLVSTIKQFSWYALYPSIIYVCLFILHFLWGKKESKIKNMRLSLLIIAMTAIAVLAMIAAPIFPERAWFGIIVLLVLASLLLYTNLELERFAIISYVITSLVVAVFLVSYGLGLNNLKRVDSILSARTEYIKEQKELGVKNVVIDGRFETDDSKLVLPIISDLPLDSVSWMGRSYGGYMGVTSITVVDAPDNSQNTEGGLP